MMSLCYCKALLPGHTASNWSKAVEGVYVNETLYSDGIDVDRSLSILLIKNCKNLSQVSMELSIWKAGEVFKTDSITEKKVRGLLELVSIMLARNLDFSAFTMI